LLVLGRYLGIGTGPSGLTAIRKTKSKLDQQFFLWKKNARENEAHDPIEGDAVIEQIENGSVTMD
jgi:hypothetical protein